MYQPMSCRVIPSQDVSHCVSSFPVPVLSCARTVVASACKRAACSVICPNTEQDSRGADTWAQVLRHERKHLVVEASGKSRMRSPRHNETFLHCAFWVFCLAIHHHQWTTRIATHDSVLDHPKCGERWHSEATPMLRKIGRALSRDLKCTHSTCNGHAHFYKARRIDVHWPFIIFGQMSWHGMPARQITLQSRHEEK